MNDTLPTIDIADPQRAEQLADELAALVNEVYAQAEGDLWVAGATRTTVEDSAVMIGRGEIALAHVGAALVGCVRVRMLAAHLGAFGMLCAHPSQRGSGLGSALVRYAETTCAAAGATTMQLELLVPTQWRHPGKEQLHEWYTRLGYRTVSTSPAAEALGSAGSLLVTPCELRAYHCPLT